MACEQLRLIVNSDVTRIIDFQSPTLTDPAFDLWAFVEEPFIRWDLHKVLTMDQRELFLKTYISVMGDKTIIDRLKKKSPLYYLKVGLYCLMRFSEYKLGHIDQEKTKGRDHLWKKYELVKNVCISKLNKQSFDSNNFT